LVIDDAEAGDSAESAVIRNSEITFICLNAGNHDI